MRKILDVCIAGNSAVNGICGDPDCVCAPQIGSELAANRAQFVAVNVAVMQGLERVAVAKSHNFAKRIARALNLHKVNEKGY